MSTLSPTSPLTSPIDISALPWSAAERAALDDLCAATDLSGFALLRQALRLYQMRHQRAKAGQEMTFRNADGSPVREHSMLAPGFTMRAPS